MSGEKLTKAIGGYFLGALEFCFAVVLMLGFMALVLGLTGNTENFIHAMLAISGEQKP